MSLSPLVSKYNTFWQLPETNDCRSMIPSDLDDSLTFLSDKVSLKLLIRGCNALTFPVQILKAFHMEQDWAWMFVSVAETLYRLKSLCMSSGLAVRLSNSLETAENLDVLCQLMFDGGLDLTWRDEKMFEFILFSNWHTVPVSLRHQGFSHAVKVSTMLDVKEAIDQSKSVTSPLNKAIFQITFFQVKKHFHVKKRQFSCPFSSVI